MLIFTSHNLNHCFQSRGTRSLWNVFEAVQNTRSTCFIGFKNTRLRLVFLNPIKHCCSCFKTVHKALYGVLNGRNQIISENSCEIYADKRAIQFSMLNPKLKHHKALCGVLNRPQSALWCFEYATKRSVVFRLRLFYTAKWARNS